MGDRVAACSEDIRNDWVEEIEAAIEKGKRCFGNSPDDQLTEKDLPKELPGAVEPVHFPDGLAEYCQVRDCIHQSLISDCLFSDQSVPR